jgi:hypothetical protein
MNENPIAAKRRAEWERIRRQGLVRYLVVRGVFLRGIPLALVVLVALSVLQGRPLDRATLLAPDFLGRVLLATLLFSAGGMLSSYARWRSLDLHFAAEEEEAGGKPRS